MTCVIKLCFRTMILEALPPESLHSEWIHFVYIQGLIRNVKRVFIGREISSRPRVQNDSSITFYHYYDTASQVRYRARHLITLEAA